MGIVPNLERKKQNAHVFNAESAWYFFQFGFSLQFRISEFLRKKKVSQRICQNKVLQKGKRIAHCIISAWYFFFELICATTAGCFLRKGAPRTGLVAQRVGREKVLPGFVGPKTAARKNPHRSLRHQNTPVALLV